MRKGYAVLVAGMLILAGCGEQRQEAQEDTAAALAEEVEQEAGEASERIRHYTSEELQNATPLSNEAMKAVLPETLGGMKRKGFNIISQAGLQSVEARYGEEGREVTLVILDGAGEVGSGMYAMGQMGLSVHAESEDEHGYMKTTSHQGFKGMEEYENGSDAEAPKSTMTLFVGERYMVTFEGEGFEMDDLKSLIDDSGVIASLTNAK